mmetsp:Transcript_17315/g.37830  ORF Transcript_17315/g.37830 Transcript_17315/m.37830 type:complete len:176 (+) Transcript_17315:516-1043(+)
MTSHPLPPLAPDHVPPWHFFVSGHWTLLAKICGGVVVAFPVLCVIIYYNWEVRRFLTGVPRWAYENRFMTFHYTLVFSCVVLSLAMAIGNFMGKSWPFGRICPLVDALLGITIVIISTYQGHRLGVLLAEQRQRIRGMGGQTSEQNGASDEDEDEDEIEMADIENDNVAHLVAAV